MVNLIFAKIELPIVLTRMKKHLACVQFHEIIFCCYFYSGCKNYFAESERVR